MKHVRHRDWYIRTSILFVEKQDKRSATLMARYCLPIKPSVGTHGEIQIEHRRASVAPRSMISRTHHVMSVGRWMSRKLQVENKDFVCAIGSGRHRARCSRSYRCDKRQAFYRETRFISIVSAPRDCSLARVGICGNRRREARVRLKRVPRGNHLRHR